MTQVLIDRATLEQLVDCPASDYERMYALKKQLHAALANAESTGWQPIETAPKDGKFLIAVWEGDWDNPKRNCTIYQATGFPSGPVWAMRGSYRTEEGGAYKLAGWMPLPTPPKEQQ